METSSSIYGNKQCEEALDWGVWYIRMRFDEIEWKEYMELVAWICWRRDSKAIWSTMEELVYPRILKANTLQVRRDEEKENAKETAEYPTSKKQKQQQQNTG